MGIAYLCGFGTVNNGESTCSKASFTAFHCLYGSGAVGCAPKADGGSKERNSAVNNNFCIAEGSKIAGAGNSESRDDPCNCHYFEDKVKKICSFHFTTSFPVVYMGCVRKNRTSVLRL